MFSNDRPEQTAVNGAEDIKPCRALVPMVPSVQWSKPIHLQLPDSIFMTQLIVAAEQPPQIRPLRRATLADAQHAYGVDLHRIVGSGIRTRQII
jgi:hypothetical protein